MRKVYLEKNVGPSSEFVSVNTYLAWQGFHLLGYECVPFDFTQMDYLDIDKESIVNGWIRSVRKAFQIVGCAEPMEVSIPKEIESYAGREIWASTLGEVRKSEARVFIKPLRGHKLFNGHVRTDLLKDLMQTAPHPDDTEVLVSEVVNFVTEYRGFVLNGKLVGWKHYLGDFALMPDVSTVKQAIMAYSSAPVAYSIDFGLTDDGRTLLIEVNDAFSLGAYGLDSILYARMIEARWDEIVNA